MTGQEKGLYLRGAVYYKGGTYCPACIESFIVKGLSHHNCYGAYTETEPTATYTAGQKFPDAVEHADIYVEGGYIYSYSSGVGWDVKANVSGPYGKILSEINGKAVTSMLGTFRGVNSLTEAPEIPESITNISCAFDGCTSLIKAPVIPSSVTDMSYAFYNCPSLEGSIEVNANPTNYYNCFSGTSKHITLLGASTRLENLANTSKKENITTAFSNLKTIPEGGIYYKGGIKCPHCSTLYGVKGMNCQYCSYSYINEPTATYTSGQDFPLIVDIGDIYIKDNQAYACTGASWILY